MLNRNQKTALKMAAISVAMFGFGYLMVPIYDVFCEITGLNGKTGARSAASASELVADEDRLVTVEFDTNVNSRLNWVFRPAVRSMEVHPGRVYEAVFYVSNRSATDTVGRAVPSVAPAKASTYFDKTECFCFSEQDLAAGESRPMPVRFVIDPDLPDTVDMLTLSYTFFPAPGTGPGGVPRT